MQAHLEHDIDGAHLPLLPLVDERLILSGVIVVRAPGVVEQGGIAEGDVKGWLHYGECCRRVLRNHGTDFILVNGDGKVPCVHLTHPTCMRKEANQAAAASAISAVQGIAFGVEGTLNAQDAGYGWQCSADLI